MSLVNSYLGGVQRRPIEILVGDAGSNRIEGDGGISPVLDLSRFEPCTVFHLLFTI